MPNWYREDLAHIHDAGHGDFALSAAAGILAEFRRYRINHGLVVDLGCGSGIWAKELRISGYECLGIDISQPMLRLARKRVPDATFRCTSIFKAKLPGCEAVTSVGECLNYLFDSSNTMIVLEQLFRRIHRALAPGGVFIFDLLEPGQLPAGSASKSFRSAADWLVTVEKSETRRPPVLTRRITSFRRVGSLYRRSEEVHQLRLYKAAEIEAALKRTGFQARICRGYGKFRLPKGHSVFIARKQCGAKRVIGSDRVSTTLR